MLSIGHGRAGGPTRVFMAALVRRLHTCGPAPKHTSVFTVYKRSTELPRFAPLLPAGEAVATKMRSFHTTGVAWPSPGRGIFQRILVASSHRMGGLPWGAAPVPRGPRHWGQFRSYSDTVSDAAASVAGKQNSITFSAHMNNNSGPFSSRAEPPRLFV